MTVCNKKGRKAKAVSTFKKTWAYFDGEWVYQGQCGSVRPSEITSRDEHYVYCTRVGSGVAIRIRQEV